MKWNCWKQPNIYSCRYTPRDKIFFVDTRFEACIYITSNVKTTDISKAIKDLQLKIWLSKPPGERLRQQLVDNDELFILWKEGKRQKGINQSKK